MRSRVFIVPAGGVPTRWPDPLPAFNFPDPLGGTPPLITDRLTDPSGDDLLSQVVLLAPRGRAWQTDEVQAPLGSTVQHRLWSVIADGLADLYRTIWRGVAAAFPSLADEEAIRNWEQDYGLPDLCLGDVPSLEQRRQQVRATLIKPDDASRRSLIGLLRAIGYNVSVHEWEGFECGMNGCGEEGLGVVEPKITWLETGAIGLGEDGLGTPHGNGNDIFHTFFVEVHDAGLRWLETGAIGLGEEGLGAVDLSGLICVVENFRHAHTRAIYLIEGVTQ